MTPDMQTDRAPGVQCSAMVGQCEQGGGSRKPGQHLARRTSQFTSCWRYGQLKLLAAIGVRTPDNASLALDLLLRLPQQRGGDSRTNEVERLAAVPTGRQLATQIHFDKIEPGPCRAIPVSATLALKNSGPNTFNGSLCFLVICWLLAHRRVAPVTPRHYLLWLHPLLRRGTLLGRRAKQGASNAAYLVL